MYCIIMKGKRQIHLFSPLFLLALEILQKKDENKIGKSKIKHKLYADGIVCKS